MGKPSNGPEHPWAKPSRACERTRPHGAHSRKMVQITGGTDRSTHDHTPKTLLTERRRVEAIASGAGRNTRERARIEAFVRWNEDLAGEPFWAAVERAKREGPPAMAEWLMKRAREAS